MMATTLALVVGLAGAFPPLTDSGHPNVQSRGALAVNLDTGEVLYARAPDTPRPIASISKLMAALVLRDVGLDLEANWKLTDDDRKLSRGGAQSRLRAGWRITHHDLLEAGLLASDNMAIVALGRSLGLEPPVFAEMMTMKARMMGLSGVHFADPTGIDHRNVASPRAVLEILKAALDDPVLASIMGQPRFEVDPVRRKRRLEYWNTVRPIRDAEWGVIGGKTGYNRAAGYCVTLANTGPEGEKLAMVFLGAEGKLTRFGDFGRVMHWVKARAEGTLPPGGEKPFFEAGEPPPEPDPEPGSPAVLLKAMAGAIQKEAPAEPTPAAAPVKREDPPAPRVRDEDAPPPVADEDAPGGAR